MENEAGDELQADRNDSTTAMVVLVQGQERWLGNETYLPATDYDQMVGAYVGIPPTLDALAAALPSGSKTALLTYGDGVQVRKPLDDTLLTGAAIGGQRDYSGSYMRSLREGLVEAARILAGDQSSHKALLVIGDGEGQKEDISAELAGIIAQLEQQGVHTFTLFHETRPDDAPQGRRNMEQLGYSAHYAVATVNDFSAIAPAIAAMLQ